MIIDAHCHIDLYNDPENIIQECYNKNIYVLSMTTTPKAWEITSRISRCNDKIFTALGFHPQIVGQRYKELELFDTLLPKVGYVGEIGLDGRAEYRDSFDRQLSVFRHILKNININGGRIMSIHSRRAADIVLDEIKNIDGIPILHWFSGTLAELNKAINYGCWFSVGLPMFISKKGREIITRIPKDKILTETDGPFTEIKDNIMRPWDINGLLWEFSIIWRCSVENVEEMIYSNFCTLKSWGNNDETIHCPNTG